MSKKTYSSELTGKRIREQRKAFHLSMQELADRIGVGLSTIKRYENNAIKNYKVETVESIAKALHIDPQYLLGETDRAYFKGDYREILEDLEGAIIFEDEFFEIRTRNLNVPGVDFFKSESCPLRKLLIKRTSWHF